MLHQILQGIATPPRSPLSTRGIDDPNVVLVGPAVQAAMRTMSSVPAAWATRRPSDWRSRSN